jgi:hypothetical protein
MRAGVAIMVLGCGGGVSPPDSLQGSPPFISGLSSTSACRGAVAAMMGQHFEGATGTINGVEARVAGFGELGGGSQFFQLEVADATPAGVGAIVVTTPFGTATTPFEVIGFHTPELASAQPTSGAVFSSVTLTGTDLTNVTVQLRTIAPPQGGTPATVTGSSATSVTFEVPVVPPGDYFIQAANGCGNGGSVDFTVQ